MNSTFNTLKWIVYVIGGVCIAFPLMYVLFGGNSTPPVAQETVSANTAVATPPAASEAPRVDPEAPTAVVEAPDASVPPPAQQGETDPRYIITDPNDTLASREFDKNAGFFQRNWLIGEIIGCIGLFALLMTGSTPVFSVFYGTNGSVSGYSRSYIPSAIPTSIPGVFIVLYLIFYWGYLFPHTHYGDIGKGVGGLIDVWLRMIFDSF